MRTKPVFWLSAIGLMGLAIMLGCTIWQGHRSGDPIPRYDHVETIVPRQYDVEGWALSPDGTKIVYYSEHEDALWFLNSDEKHSVSDCRLAIWIDASHLLCDDNRILQTDTLTRLEFTEVASNTIDVDASLHNADEIFAATLIWNDTTDIYMVTAISDEHVRVRLPETEAETYLQNYTPITVTMPAGPRPIYIENIPSMFLEDPPVPSPDGAYYYERDFYKTIRIRSVATDEIIVSLTVPDEGDYRLRVGGWAHDSSGVYFGAGPTSGGEGALWIPLTLGPRGIYKLKVP